MKKFLLLFWSLMTVSCSSMDEVFIFKVSEEDPVEFENFVSTLNQHQVVILGEYHDQRSHHDFRAHVVQAISLYTRKQKVVGFEHVQNDKQDILNNFRKRKNAYTHIDDLAHELRWKSQWGGWELFRTLFQEVYATDFLVQALNLTREKMTDVVRNGKKALDPEFIKSMGLEKKFSPQIQKRLEESIQKGHCYKAPPSLVKAMYFAQRTRDAFMTKRVLMRMKEAQGALVMVGNEHARRDYGMPWYFRFKGFHDVISVKLENLTSPGTPQWNPADYKAYDYVVFITPSKTSTTDPCDGFPS